MSFVHEEADFPELLRIVARAREISEALVEKDYWVTHVLWGLHELGLEIWFKGGTSLSKGFGLITRFSEDLDLRIDRGTVSGLPVVHNWGSKSAGRVKEREAYFEALEAVIQVPDVTVTLDRSNRDDLVRSGDYRCTYPGTHLDALPPAVKPYVLLEVGNALVEPYVERPISSFVHAYLDERGQADEFRDNRVQAVRCVHPLVTLLEKLDAICKHYAKPTFQPARFVRHYEDAARIIESADELPPTEEALDDLARSMVDDKAIKRLLGPEEPALRLDDDEKRGALTKAHHDIGPMFWGERMTLEDACARIQEWLSERDWVH